MGDEIFWNQETCDGCIPTETLYFRDAKVEGQEFTAQGFTNILQMPTILYTCNMTK